MLRSNVLLAIKYLAVDLALSVLYFPVWWYTKGLARAGAYCAGVVGNAARSFGVRNWFKNIFKPMFGQYDIAGRIISFFMRLAMMLYYSVVLLVLIVIMLALFLFWLALPVFIGYNFFTQFVSVLKTARP